MRVANRSDEIATVQVESTQVAVELRKALGSVCRAEAPSPVQEGLPRFPSPARGHLYHAERESCRMLWELLRFQIGATQGCPDNFDTAGDKPVRDLGGGGPPSGNAGSTAWPAS